MPKSEVFVGKYHHLRPSGEPYPAIRSGSSRRTKGAAPILLPVPDVRDRTDVVRRRNIAKRRTLILLRTVVKYGAGSRSQGVRTACDKSMGGMKRLALITCALILAAGCSKGADTATSTTSAAPAASGAAASSGKTIGVSIQNREAQFYQTMEAGMKSEAQKYGYTVNVVDASRDNSKQQSQVEDFISQKGRGDRSDAVRFASHRLGHRRGQ